LLYFGGVPQELLFDQMKSVITRDLRLEGGALVRNAEFLRFAHHSQGAAADASNSPITSAAKRAGGSPTASIVNGEAMPRSTSLVRFSVRSRRGRWRTPLSAISGRPTEGGRYD
jgi:hypothetical protein